MYIYVCHVRRYKQLPPFRLLKDAKSTHSIAGEDWVKKASSVITANGVMPQ